MDEQSIKGIDATLRNWRQGDCALGKSWFLFRLDVEAPLTREAIEAAAQGVDAGEAEVRGFMIATQTCDIVRSCIDRPYIEVCPLVEVDSESMKDIQRHRRPAYAYVPGVADQRLVADLDRVMTVEKAVLAKWSRTRGCWTDGDVRQLGLALARKRRRVAFPDDFVNFARPLVRRLRSKHAKRSTEGEALRNLREIRVRATPSWEDDKIEIMFYFIPNDDSASRQRGWDVHLESWLDRLDASGRFVAVDGIIQSLDDLSARDYVESDPLDLDDLTLRQD